MGIHVAVSDAKTQLSELLNRVQAGERVTITVRGEAVADLVMSAEGKASRRKAAGAILRAMMADGMEKGWTQEDVSRARAHGRR